MSAKRLLQFHCLLEYMHILKINKMLLAFKNSELFPGFYYGVAKVHRVLAHCYVVLLDG